ncbi:MAG: outer membrane beta-barrel protein [Gammaproteobacteria bacterium]|nr:outer membrane beta-barrel protein [Gammaproteobacteria bacterium]
MIKKLALLICFLALSSSVFAAMPLAKGLYVGANAGYSKVDETVSGSHKQNNGNFGASANVGYKFSPYLGVELGYTQYANEEFDYNINGKDNFAVDLALKGILPLGNTGLSIFAKAGAAAVHHTLEDGIVKVSNAGNHFEPAIYGGVGASFAITQNLAINGEATGTTKNGNVPAMYLFSGGVTYILPASLFE